MKALRMLLTWLVVLVLLGVAAAPFVYAYVCQVKGC